MADFGPRNVHILLTKFSDHNLFVYLFVRLFVHVVLFFICLLSVSMRELSRSGVEVCAVASGGCHHRVRCRLGASIRYGNGRGGLY